MRLAAAPLCAVAGRRVMPLAVMSPALMDRTGILPRPVPLSGLIGRVSA
jgi:hypothetical protein